MVRECKHCDSSCELEKIQPYVNYLLYIITVVRQVIDVLELPPTPRAVDDRVATMSNVDCGGVLEEVSFLFFDILSKSFSRLQYMPT